MKLILTILLSVFAFNLQAAVVNVSRITFSIPTQTIHGDPLIGENAIAGLALTCDRVGAGDPSTWAFRRVITPATWTEGVDKNGSTAVVWLLNDIFTKTTVTTLYCVAQFYNTVNDHAPYSEVISFDRTGPGTYVYENGIPLSASPMATDVNLE